MTLATTANPQLDRRPTFCKLLTHSTDFGILSLPVMFENCLTRDLSSSHCQHDLRLTPCQGRGGQT